MDFPSGASPVRIWLGENSCSNSMLVSNSTNWLGDKFGTVPDRATASFVVTLIAGVVASV